MKCASIILALLGLGAGIRASLIWWNASKVENSPEIIPDDPVAGTMVWAESTKKAFEDAGKLNAQAAAWTAASVALNALGAIAGAFSN
ncbi:hypothetical protein [Methylocapsa sp. S129]|uniref:hypothetical protein n=1 Tax=Methylocapsa sp. S129 TaxID=1641869 RepID=UPI00131CFAC5|nr:hypothetical protein [Methylocapsa sp. S129]